MKTKIKPSSRDIAIAKAIGKTIKAAYLLRRRSGFIKTVRRVVYEG